MCWVFLSLTITAEVIVLEMRKPKLSLNNLPKVIRLVEGLDKILEKICLTPYNKTIHESRHPPGIC